MTLTPEQQSIDKRPPGIGTSFRNFDYEEDIARLKRMAGSGGGGGTAIQAAFWSGTGTTVSTGTGWVNVPIANGTSDPAGAFTWNADGSISVKDAGWYYIDVNVFGQAANVAYHITIGGSSGAPNGVGENYIN